MGIAPRRHADLTRWRADAGAISSPVNNRGSFSDRYNRESQVDAVANRLQFVVTLFAIEKDATESRKRHLHGESGGEKECLEVPPLETLAAQVGREKEKGERDRETFARAWNSRIDQELTSY